MVKLNKSEFKWLLILIGFSYYIYYLLHTCKIYIFVHPRMVIYIQFSLVVFIILTLFQLKRIFIVTHHKRKISFIIFLIPLILGIYINPQGLNNEIESKKGISMLENSSQTNKAATVQASENTKKSQTSNNNISDKTTIENTADSSAQDTNNTTITIDKDNFIDLIDNLYSDTTNIYKGKKIVMTGFVYRDKTLTQNQFVTARLVITCCIADAEVTGLLCDWNGSAKLNTDSWVKVTGTLDTETRKEEGDNVVVPIIRVNSVEPAEKPQNQYIYAN